MAETKPASDPVSLAKGASAKGGKKTKLVLLAVPVLLLCGGLGLWFSGILPGLLGMHPAQPETVSGGARPAASRLPIFVQMPDITANLNASGRRATFIKMRSQIEVLGQDDAAALTSALPRLVDLFTVYLREIRPEELRGSAGTHRLREELIARANIAAHPARVTDVLFQEILMQ